MILTPVLCHHQILGGVVLLLPPLLRWKEEHQLNVWLKTECWIWRSLSSTDHKGDYTCPVHVYIV